MRLYKSTGCNVTLIGYLKQISTIKTTLVLERKRLHNTEYYCVHADEIDIARITQFGYLGMLLSVTGDFYSSKNTMSAYPEIVAEKIDFMHMPQEGKFDTVSDIDKAASLQINEKFKIPLSIHSSLYAAASRNVH